MDTFFCTRPYFEAEDDKEKFFEDYVGWKKGKFNCQGIFADTFVEKAIPDGDSQHHPFLDIEAVVSQVFNRLSKTDKRNMVEVCKSWSAWFLVGTRTSKVFADYNRELVSENNGGMITVQRGHKVVRRFCICTSYVSIRQKYDFHRRIEAEQARADDYIVNPCNDSGDDSDSEGFYDSDY